MLLPVISLMSLIMQYHFRLIGLSFCQGSPAIQAIKSKLRVDSISASRQPCLDRAPDLSSEIIERCYRQIYFHAMSCDRDRFLESQLRSGSITVRDFIRGLLLSDRFYRGYVECNGNDRLVEQVIGRVLGRPVYGQDE